MGKAVKHNYHIRCGPCVEKSGKCAKCGEQASQFVNAAEPNPKEVARQEAEFQRDLNSLQSKSYGDIEEDAEAAKKQLNKMKDKYGKDGGGFDLDDLDEDFDDLGIDDLSCSEE